MEEYRIVLPHACNFYKAHAGVLKDTENKEECMLFANEEKLEKCIDKIKDLFKSTWLKNQKEFKGQGCYHWITLGSPQLNISVKCDTIKEESHTKNQRYNYFSNKDVADNLYKELIDLLRKYGVKI